MNLTVTAANADAVAVDPTVAGEMNAGTRRMLSPSILSDEPGEVNRTFTLLTPPGPDSLLMKFKYYSFSGYGSIMYNVKVPRDEAIAGSDLKVTNTKFRLKKNSFVNGSNVFLEVRGYVFENDDSIIAISFI